MQKAMRGLNSREQHELLYALSLARSRNERHANECFEEANKCDNEQTHGCYAAEAIRYEEWADMDADLIEAIRLGRVVILVEDKGADKGAKAED